MTTGIPRRRRLLSPPRYRKHARVRYRGRAATVLRVTRAGNSWAYALAVGLLLVTGVAEADIVPLTRPGKGRPDMRKPLLAIAALALLSACAGCHAVEIREVSFRIDLLHVEANAPDR